MRKISAVIILILYAFILRLICIDLPFNDSMTDAINARLGFIARNYLRLGYLPMKFLPVINTGPIIATNELSYYNNHPPLSPIMLSFFYKLFGISELSTRIMPVIFSVATLMIFFLLVKLFWSRNVAYLSLLFMATMPIQVIYSQKIDYEGPGLLFFAIATLYFYLKWFLTDKRYYICASFISFVLGAFSDWSIYFLAPLLAVHYLLYCRRRDRFKISICIMITASAVFLTTITYLILTKGDLNILKIFLWRANLSHGHIDIFRWLYNIGSFSLYLFTPFIIFLSSLWLIMDGIKKPFVEHKFLVFILFFFGFLNIAVFSQISYIHEFWIFNLTPWASLSAAIALDRLFSRQNMKIKYMSILSSVGLGSALVLSAAFFLTPAKRIDWVNLYIIFSVSPFIMGLISQRFAIKISKTLLIFSAITYLLLSVWQVYWDRMYWHTASIKTTGEFIKNNSPYDSTVILSSESSGLVFYMDRNTAVIKSTNDFDNLIGNGNKQRCSFFVVDAKDISAIRPLYSYLSDNYKAQSFGRYAVFDLLSKKYKG